MSERYLDSPEYNTPACEDCGGEMENKNKSIMHIRGASADWQCCNPHCPSKFDDDSTAYAMALELVDLRDTVAILRKQVARLRSELEVTKPKSK